jgi:hypothetical protein
MSNRLGSFGAEGRLLDHLQQICGHSVPQRGLTHRPPLQIRRRKTDEHNSCGCLCGRVRYTLTSEPIRTYVCHCRDCQRATAAPFAAGIAFPASSVSLQGELKTFDMAGGSGQTAHRNFCPNCGSWVTGSSSPDFISVLVGTLDDPNLFEPEFEQFFGSAKRWMHAESDRVRYPGRRT